MSQSVKGSSSRTPKAGCRGARFSSVPRWSGSSRCSAMLPGGSLAYAGEKPGRAGAEHPGYPGRRDARASVYTARAIREALLPNLTRLADQGVDFTNHHIARAPRSPAPAWRRAVLPSDGRFQLWRRSGLNTGFPTTTMLPAWGMTRSGSVNGT